MEHGVRREAEQGAKQGAKHGATPGVSRRMALASGGVSAVGALGALAACATPGAPGGGGPALAGPAQLKAGATIVFWNDQAGAYPDLMQRWGATFQQRTGVKVEVSGGIAGYGDKLAAGFAGGAPPDVYRYLYASIPLPGAIERKMLLKLDALVKRDKYDLSEFRKDAIKLYRWKGSLWALPRDYGLQLVYYNTDVFRREGLPPLPTDWNDKTWTSRSSSRRACASRAVANGTRCSCPAGSGCGRRSSTATAGPSSRRTRTGSPPSSRWRSSRRSPRCS